MTSTLLAKSTTKKSKPLNKSNQTVEQFLLERRTDGPFNFSSIDPPAKYDVERSAWWRFFDLYYTRTQDKTKSTLTIAENVRNNMYVPWIIDMDFKGTTNQPLWTDEDLWVILKLVHKVVTDRLSPIQREHMVSVVLTKPHRFEDDVCRHGLHIHLPFIYILKDSISDAIVDYFRTLVKEELTTNGLFLQRLSNRSDIYSIVDDVSKKPWLMYGSSKSTSGKPYTISSCYYLDTLEQCTLYDACGGRIYDYDIGGFRVLTMEQFEALIPYVLSTKDVCSEYHRTTKDYARKVYGRVDLNEDKDDSDEEVLLSDDEQNLPSDIIFGSGTEFMKSILSILKGDVLENNNSWWKVGFMLYNLTNGSEEGLKLWIDWTRSKSNWNKTPKYTMDGMAKRWRESMHMRYTPSECTKSLMSMAYKINPEAVIELNKQHREDDLLEKCSYSSDDLTVVEYIDKIYRNDYVSCSKKADQFYHFDETTGLWKEARSRHDRILSIEIGTTVTVSFKKYEKRLKTQLNQMSANESTDPDDIKSLTARIENIGICIKKLRRANKSSIMVELRHWFYNRDFLQNLDQNPMLFSFANGVYDLNTRMIEKGKRTDLVSMRADTELLEATREDKLALVDYLNKIFPNPIIREYFLEVYSHIFFGGNKFKQVYFWSGAQGNNGKTVTQKLFTAMLGEYAKEIPITAFTHKHGASNSASPEQARVVKCRLVYANEPEASDSLNIGFIKARTGNDRFFVRTLYSEGFEADPMFKLNIICNNPPKAEGADNAFWNRVVVFPFESVFDSKAPDDEEEQMRLRHFKADPCIEERLPRLAQALAWELVSRYERNGIKPIPIPDVIKEQVDRYQRCNNNFVIFMNEFVEKSDNEMEVFRFEEALQQFKRWLSPRAIERRSPSMKDAFKKALTDHCGEPDEYSRWSGWRLLPDS